MTERKTEKSKKAHILAPEPPTCSARASVLHTTVSLIVPSHHAEPGWQALVPLRCTFNCIGSLRSRPHAPYHTTLLSTSSSAASAATPLQPGHRSSGESGAEGLRCAAPRFLRRALCPRTPTVCPCASLCALYWDRHWDETVCHGLYWQGPVAG